MRERGSKGREGGRFWKTIQGSCVPTFPLAMQVLPLCACSSLEFHIFLNLKIFLFNQRVS